MKKYALAAFGLMLAAAPAFAASGNSVTLDQKTFNNTIGNAEDSRTVGDASNGGVSASGLDGTSGIVTQNLNTGSASNVGAITEVTGLSVSSSSAVGSNKGDTAKLTQVSLDQVTTKNVIGNAEDRSAKASAYNNGVEGAQINHSNGLVTQQINTGYASNVGSITAVSVR